jgi:hypothetical protein
MKIEIACPKCNWKPDGGKHWECDCGHVWDTFATAARCPACGKQHHETQCPWDVAGCGKFSPHIDWYRNLDTITQYEIDKSFSKINLLEENLDDLIN